MTAYTSAVASVQIATLTPKTIVIKRGITSALNLREKLNYWWREGRRGGKYAAKPNTKGS